MELSDAIKGRRSVRKFLDRKVDAAAVKKLVEAAIWAPSACNYQGWRFIVIDDKAVLNRIVDAGGALFLRNAPMAILVLYINSSDNSEYRDELLSGAAGVQNMLLTAHSLGLGACFVCHLPRKDTLRKICGIPKNYEPVSLVALGYPAIKPVQMQRINTPDEITCFNRFSISEKSPASTGAGKSKNTFARKMARKIYYFMPTFVKKKIEPLADKFEKKFEN